MRQKFEVRPEYRCNELIFKAVEAARNFEGLTDANQYFAGLCESEPDFVKLTNNVYHYKDYYINVGKRFTMAGHAQNVMSVADWKLSCAPEGIAYIWMDNGEDMLLVTRIPGSENHSIVPYSEVQMSAADAAEAKRRLLADVDCMMEKNYACLAITEEPDAWHILEGENRIIISNWRFAFVSDKAKDIYRKRVLGVLGMDE